MRRYSTHRIASAVVLKIVLLRGCYANVVRFRLGDLSFEIFLVPTNSLCDTYLASAAMPIVNFPMRSCRVKLQKFFPWSRYWRSRLSSMGCLPPTIQPDVAGLKVLELTFPVKRTFRERLR